MSTSLKNLLRKLLLKSVLSYKTFQKWQKQEWTLAKPWATISLRSARPKRISVPFTEPLIWSFLRPWLGKGIKDLSKDRSLPFESKTYFMQANWVEFSQKIKFLYFKKSLRSSMIQKFSMESEILLGKIVLFQQKC